MIIFRKSKRIRELEHQVYWLQQDASTAAKTVANLREDVRKLHAETRIFQNNWDFITVRQAILELMRIQKLKVQRPEDSPLLVPEKKQ